MSLRDPRKCLYDKWNVVETKLDGLSQKVQSILKERI